MRCPRQGRILAAAYGFPRVRGIDLDRWRRRTGKSCDAEVDAADARNYRVQPDESVFFFFNPSPRTS